MERRDDKRWARRVPVRFWKRGEEKARSGFTTNISTGGMFIGSSLVFGRGTRVRVEVLDPVNGFMVEGVVARAIRTQPNLQRLRASGMGIRFVKVADLVAELFPPGQVHKLAPPPPDEPKPAPVQSPKPVQSPPPSSPAVNRHSQEIPAAHTYALQFRSAEDLRLSFERDMSQGGLFITTPAPAPLQQVVMIEISVFGVPVTPVRLRARVVHCTEPGSVGVETNLLAGMGLEMLEPQLARDSVAYLLDQAEKLTGVQGLPAGA